MVNNFKNKNKKIWYAIIIVALLSVLAIALIIYNKWTSDRNPVINMGSSSSMLNSSSSTSEDKPMDIIPPSVSIPR